MDDELYAPIIIYKGRTKEIIVDLGINVSSDTFHSQIRSAEDVSSSLIAEFTVAFLTDGTDGKLKLTLDNSVTSLIRHKTGYMDIKRTTSGEPVPAFDGVLQVVFKGSVTA